MKKIFKNMILIGAMTMFVSGFANAEVVLGGYSFNDPTPKQQSNDRSITDNAVINIGVGKKATSEEKKYFTNAIFFANMLKPNAILLFKNLDSLEQCEKDLKSVNSYVVNRYESKGYNKAPIVRKTFAATFERNYVSFGKFKDNGITYNVTTGCKQKEGYVSLFYQVDKM